MWQTVDQFMDTHTLKAGDRLHVHVIGIGFFIGTVDEVYDYIDVTRSRYKGFRLEWPTPVANMLHSTVGYGSIYFWLASCDETRQAINGGVCFPWAIGVLCG